MQFKFSGFIVRKKKTTSEFNLYFLPKECLDIFSGDLGIVELNVTLDFCEAEANNLPKIRSQCWLALLTPTLGYQGVLFCGAASGPLARLTYPPP